MFIEGYILENMYKDESLVKHMKERMKPEIFAIFDRNFIENSAFVAGAPTLHIAVEPLTDGFSCLVYLDLKSSTYTYGIQDVDDEFSAHVETWAQNFIWQDTVMKLNCESPFEEVLDEISFFTGFNIYILGYSSTDKKRFEELKEMVSEFPCFTSEKETNYLKQEALLVNIMAVENIKYSDNEKKYVIPSVGIEGVELWLGTNPTFYKIISDDKDSEEQKYNKKFLFNFVFSRICSKIAEEFDIPSYSVSKVEKAFIVGSLEIDRLVELLDTINFVNEKATIFFDEIFKMISEDTGKVIYEGKKKFDQLAAFYDEKNFVSLIAYSFSDNDEVYRQLSKNLLENVIPKVTESISSCKTKIDERIKKYFEGMRR